MMKSLHKLILITTLSSVSAQGINSTAAYDDFGKTSPYTVVTTEMFLDPITHVGDPTKKAYKGIYWGTKTATGGLDFTKERLGDGKQTYVVNQAANAYEPFGVSFGTYAKSTTPGDSAFFTIDLAMDAYVSFTLKNTSAIDLSFKVGLIDINDSLLNAYSEPLPGYNNADLFDGNISTKDNTAYNAPYHNYELNISVPKNSAKNIGIDFKSAVHVFYKLNTDGTVRTSESGGHIGCKDIPNYSSASTFLFDKIKAFTIIPLNSELSTNSSAPDCGGPKALVSGTFEISNFMMPRQPTSVIDKAICGFYEEESVFIYNSSGGFITQGKVTELNLEPGFYIFKSQTKAVKVIMK